MAEPIGLMEKYALAPDRSAMLAELIPGSEDYYFYHCLHYQTVGQTDRSEAILKEWIAENKGQETPVISGMLDRQRLLTYNESPQRTVDYLVKRLGVNLNHAPPVSQGERRFPSKLDADELDVQRLVADALLRNDALKPLGMAHVAQQFRTGDAAGLRISPHDFLKRVDGPYFVGLDELVIKELASRKDNDKRFGDLRAHTYLTLEELDRVAQRVPQITDDNEFVTARLNRLRVGGDNDISQQPAVRLEYLQRVEAYVRKLPQSYNSLKAAATYRLLEANLANGVYDRDLFLRYLQLPRNSPIVHIQWGRRDQRANLGEDFLGIALLSPIGDEQALVREYLENFLRDAKDTSEFAQYLRPEYLKRTFAEIKLTAGVGDPQDWYAMLTAPQRQAIRDAVQVRLTSQNKVRFGKDEPTKLIVDVKNIDELVVRIYEINSDAYYRSNSKPLNTDIDLDGLVASSEKKITYNQPAVQRHRETLSLEEISGRGVWIVDLVGKGVRARAMIRRGEIHHVDSTVANGMLFTIIDENQKPIPGATMLVGSQEFVADENGRIGLPPIANQVERHAIMSDGKVAQRIEFRHLQESYRLDAGMHIDRTQLQSGGTGQLVIRPRVTMSGEIVAPELLKDVSVLIQATDLDNLTTTIQLENLELSQNKELVIPFRVPPRLSNIQATLSGKIAAISNGRNQSVETSRSWDIAGIRRSSHTHDAFLTRDADNFTIEVRGRTGEKIAGATVSVSLTTDLRNAPIEQTLQSDDNGQVQLGALPGVTSLHYSIPGGMHHERDLQLDRVVWASEIHTTTEQPVRLPLAEEIKSAADRYRLLEIRGGSFHSDVSDQLSVDEGLLTTAKLPAGDYHLIDRADGYRTQIIVVDGPQIGSVVAGETRHRSISPNQPLGIASIDRNDGAIRIKLSGDTRFARVHVYASRFLDSTDPLSHLGLPLPRLSGRSVALPRCGYISDLRLGDEYQYVLRRQYAAKYPGVMLPQPSVILNPWETESTTNTTQTAQAGDAPRAAPMAADSEAMSRAADKADAQARAESSDFDFLADAGVLAANLAVDEDGFVTIPADVVDGLPIVQIVVSDPATLLQRTITAPLKDAETVDLRLAKALAAEEALSFERAVSIVSKDNPLDLQSLGSAQVQVYGSVAALFKLYKTLQSDSRLNDFDDLAFWHKLDEAKKLDAYTRLASHELHLFLWSHDREFFDAVVKDYLANKKEKQFIDHWLLGNDLKPYSRLWKYNQLNAAERALLAIRLPDVRESIRRELSEIVTNQDDNHQAIRQQIEHALITGGMAMDFESESLGESVALGFDMDGAAVLGKRITPDASAWDGLSMRRQSQRESKSRGLTRAKQESGAAGAFYAGRVTGGGFAGKAFGFYQELDATKQWAESHWDRIRVVGGPAPSGLIGVNPFWQDLANNDGNIFTPSSHLLRPVDSRHSVLLALALCGLPLQAGEIGLPTEKDTPYAPEHAVAVVTKRLKSLEPSDENSSVLVGQQFALLHERQSKKKSPVEPKEFLTDTAYRGQTVISNPTAERKLVDVFWQIPAGSLPLSGSQVTDSRTITLEPFAVQAIEYQFYFPSAGQFTHYPATVASEGKLLARGSEKTFNVVVQPTEDDTVTWEKIARTGSPEQMREFLSDANLRDLDWMLVAHRMNDQDVYKTITTVLDDANLPMKDLWAYSLKHRDDDGMKAFLTLREDLVQHVGPVFQSLLLDVQPIEQRTHEVLEYAPLVRARIHRLGSENEILNATFLRQYQSFVRTLGFQKQTPPNEQLVLTYYLLLQNRIEEAIEAFGKIDRGAIDTKMQYDYMAAYLALHREAYDEAGKIAAQYVDHPIPRWKNRFGEINNQLHQRGSLMQTEQLVSATENVAEKKAVTEGSGDLAVLDREQRQAAATDLQPEVIVKVDGDTLRIDHRRAKNVTLNLYGVDLELLFSKAPFVREDLQRMAIVKPMRRDSLEFDDATGVGSFQLDDNLRRQTLLVEVIAGASRSTALYYGGEMTTYVSESFGQLQTSDATSHRPITKAYVKVYAKYPDGSVKFYKDGYTDLRGRFDYTSISAEAARGATRFAILVMSEEKGATLHDVAPPTR
ncbi:MAG: hypothetical protein WBD20_18920 [Pirellulaceae bacterium]